MRSHDYEYGYAILALQQCPRPGGLGTGRYGENKDRVAWVTEVNTKLVTVVISYILG